MRATFALGLSITAMPILVNGQGQSLSSVNKDNSSSKTGLKDSIKDTKTDISRLIAVVLKTGTSENTGSNLAPVIGLPKAMSTMDVELPITQKPDLTETRRCFVVYERIEGQKGETVDKRPMCAYIVRAKRSGLDKETKYFKFDLNGNLEKVVLSNGKYDASGKVVRGSGVKTDLDINSPEVKKTFDAEMKFWLKDWLKKQQKVPAKKA
ncbi:MAG: hypothetical protein HYX59_15330 [Elusimicrobia bacterium]|nr:hypothetical protein [Elusimicrobiota bacterium]